MQHEGRGQEAAIQHEALPSAVLQLRDLEKLKLLPLAPGGQQKGSGNKPLLSLLVSLVTSSHSEIASWPTQ